MSETRGIRSDAGAEDISANERASRSRELAEYRGELNKIYLLEEFQGMPEAAAMAL
jgi:hypothetical protein